MRVAVVSDCMSAYGGAERVIEEILGIYPGADLYAVLDLVPKAQRGFLEGRTVRTSFLQRFPRSIAIIRSSWRFGDWQSSNLTLRIMISWSQATIA